MYIILDNFRNKKKNLRAAEVLCVVNQLYSIHFLMNQTVIFFITP